MKTMIAAVALLCAVNAAAQANFTVPAQAAGFAKQISAQKAESQAAAFPTPEENAAFPMIAKRLTPVDSRGAQSQDCDARTEDGLPLGCAIALTPTGETSEDGLPLLNVPLNAPVPHYGDLGDATLTFDVKGNVIEAVYELCHAIGAGDSGIRCSAAEFAFDHLAYNKADRTISMGNAVIAQYQDAKNWYFPAYLSKDAHGAGWVMTDGLKLVSSWVAQGKGEPQLQVAIVRSQSK